MIDIYTVSVLDLLPPNLKQDQDIIAASKAVDNEFSLVVDEVKNCIILPRIDELESDLVDLLAWELHVDFYDSSLPIEIRRTLVKNSTRWHRGKGTAGAVEEIAGTVFGDSKLQEWFQYGGKPYFFKINVDVSKTGASVDNIKLLDRLIEGYKNKRSWLEIINIFLTCYGQVYYGSCIASGEEIQVFPWQITELKNTEQINLSVRHISGESIIVYPKEV